MAMTYPVRKFVGTLLLLALLVVYALLIMVFAASKLPEMGGALTLLFYIVAGIGWVPIAMYIVGWMYRRDTVRRDA